MENALLSKSIRSSSVNTAQKANIYRIEQNGKNILNSSLGQTIGNDLGQQNTSHLFDKLGLIGDKILRKSGGLTHFQALKRKKLEKYAKIGIFPKNTSSGSPSREKSAKKSYNTSKAPAGARMDFLTPIKAENNLSVKSPKQKSFFLFKKAGATLRKNSRKA